MNGKELYTRYKEVIGVDGGSFGNLELRVQEAWNELADDAIAVYKRAFEMSIVDRRVDMKFDNECAEADYWLNLAKADLILKNNSK